MSNSVMMELIESFERTAKELRNLKGTMELVVEAQKIDPTVITDKDKAVVLRKVYHTVSSCCAEVMVMLVAPQIILDADAAIKLVQIHQQEIVSQSIYWAKDIVEQSPEEVFKAMRAQKA